MELIIIGAVSLGLLWSLMAIGVFMTFRILNMPDLSVEGTVVLGAATAARLISTGHNPFLSTILAALVGSVGGLVTGILHTKLKIPPILSGILTMVASYSVVLRIMGASNIGLPAHGPNEVVSVFSFLHPILSRFTFLVEMGLVRQVSIMIFAAVVAVVVAAAYYFFCGTEIGSTIRATGNSKQMVAAQGVNTNAMIVMCLMISNGFVALSGALVVQQQGFASVDMGVGTIVVGLASVIIAEVLFNVRRFWARLITLIVGSIIYRLIIALVLELGMPPTDMRLFVAIIVVIALTLPLVRNKLFKPSGKTKERGGESK
ncbi:MAG: ABC transporter permease [Oscillospiraceae bacterium]|nr:ABC transporter permease [Oscillospiraceae bacterium]